MIYKELDPFASDDKYARSGRAAEEQMAFYLKRFFANDPNVFVLNGIRLERDGDAAQIDHLVIHAHGVAIIESKSVHGKIQIKDDGQWIRWFNGNQSKGMASPITQARLQEKFFREELRSASSNPAVFEKLPFEIYVAISNDGVILWPTSGAVAGVCKADQVPDRILASVQGAASIPGAFQLPAAGREKIAAYLVASHKPLLKDPHIERAAEPSAPSLLLEPDLSESVASATGHCCKHCRSTQLEVRFAYTYHFYCHACDKNTPIKPVCSNCSEPAKLRKQKNDFFVDCAKCDRSVLYFTNP